MDIFDILFIAISFIFLIIIYFCNQKLNTELNYFTNPYQKEINKMETSLSPQESEELADLLIQNNKEQYKKYIKQKKELEKDEIDYNLGYSMLKGTDENTLGLCPLGSYFMGKYDKNTIENIDVIKRCKKCKKCNKVNGYYTSGGCMGNNDVICKNINDEPISHQKFINSHKYPFFLHNELPKHKHYEYKDLKNRNKDFWLSNEEHKHINI